MQVEQVNYDINWARFQRGCSFFIPCLDTDKAALDIRAAVKRLGYQIVIKAVIVEGIKGLRVWRV